MHLNLRKQNSKDTEIARPKTLSGIDALYFQVKVPYEDYSEFFKKSILTNSLSDSDMFSMNGYSEAGTKQYTYYSVFVSEMESNLFDGSERSERQLCSIGFKNLNQKDNLESIFIQMNTIAMHILGYKESYRLILDVIRGLGIPILGTKVNRLDLNTYVFNHSFEYLNYGLFSTRLLWSQEKVGYDTIYKNDVLQTFYLGKRGAKGIFVRIYNKFQELISKDDINGVKMAIIKRRYAEKYKVELNSICIWNVEFEVKRQELLRYGIDTVEDVFNKSDGMHRWSPRRRIN